MWYEETIMYYLISKNENTKMYIKTNDHEMVKYFIRYFNVVQVSWFRYCLSLWFGL